MKTKNVDKRKVRTVSIWRRQIRRKRKGKKEKIKIILKREDYDVAEKGQKNDKVKGGRQAEDKPVTLYGVLIHFIIILPETIYTILFKIISLKHILWHETLNYRPTSTRQELPA
jgi:hypothetical protein